MWSSNSGLSCLGCQGTFQPQGRPLEQTESAAGVGTRHVDVRIVFARSSVRLEPDVQRKKLAVGQGFVRDGDETQIGADRDRVHVRALSGNCA